MFCQHPYKINAAVPYGGGELSTLQNTVPAHSRLTVENIMHPLHNNMEYSPAGTGKGRFLSKVSRK